MLSLVHDLDGALVDTTVLGLANLHQQSGFSFGADARFSAIELVSGTQESPDCVKLDKRQEAICRALANSGEYSLIQITYLQAALILKVATWISNKHQQEFGGGRGGENNFTKLFVRAYAFTCNQLRSAGRSSETGTLIFAPEKQRNQSKVSGKKNDLAWIPDDTAWIGFNSSINHMNPLSVQSLTIEISMVASQVLKKINGTGFGILGGLNKFEREMNVCAYSVGSLYLMIPSDGAGRADGVVPEIAMMTRALWTWSALFDTGAEGSRRMNTACLIAIHSGRFVSFCFYILVRSYLNLD